MPLNVCPADVVHAPAELVWRFLADPAGYGGFWDMTVERVDPPGTARAGQRFTAWTRELCRRFHIAGQIVEVNADRREIVFRMQLPFGVVGDNRMSCAPMDARTCMLRFG